MRCHRVRHKLEPNSDSASPSPRRTRSRTESVTVNTMIYEVTSTRLVMTVSVYGERESEGRERRERGERGEERGERERERAEVKERGPIFDQQREKKSFFMSYI